MTSPNEAPPHPPAREAVLRLTGVCRHYGGLRAVSDVSFEVASGERRAVIGPNGAGKTTLFKMISREEPTTKGRVEFLGRDITKMPAYRVAKLGLSRTYQITRVFPSLTVLENVVLATQGLRPGKYQMFKAAMSNKTLVEESKQAVERVGLQRVARSPAAELGHGEQRQLELGIALAQEPTLLLLDEPAAGLSAVERGMMRDLVRDLPDDMTVLLIEHDMELALGLADYVTCLHNGSQVAEGNPEEIKNNERVQDIYLGRGD
ncbi:MAG: ABC transporter ATP-binding protein [Actinomycetota bacterium]